MVPAWPFPYHYPLVGGKPHGLSELDDLLALSRCEHSLDHTSTRHGLDLSCTCQALGLPVENFSRQCPTHVTVVFHVKQSNSKPLSIPALLTPGCTLLELGHHARLEKGQQLPYNTVCLVHF